LTEDDKVEVIAFWLISNSFPLKFWKNIRNSMKALFVFTLLPTLAFSQSLGIAGKVIGYSQKNPGCEVTTPDLSNCEVLRLLKEGYYGPKRRNVALTLDDRDNSKIYEIHQ
jgi:hypothetical protein